MTMNRTFSPAPSERTVDHPRTDLDTFARRHHGQTPADDAAMLHAVGVASIDELIGRTVPPGIRSDRPLQLAGLDADQPLGEAAVLTKLRSIADQNQVFTSMIGMGYYGTRTPPVILRNVIENPLWYTPYTPYQAEISQGRLEGLLNFQTMVSDLTGLPLASASLLDEATAAAEAMAMCYAIGRQLKRRFYVAEDCHPQTIAVVRTRAAGLGIEVVVGPTADVAAALTQDQGGFCGLLLQYPTTDGRIEDYAGLTALAHEHGVTVVAATDLLACCLLKPPGEWEADIAIGSAQRFGVPMGYGGPHAAFMATKTEHARRMPGRIVGVSKDALGNPAYRLAVQTREQHIRRDKATSNICTAQALLANVAGFYAVYHGPAGIKAIAQRVHRLTRLAAEGLRRAFARHNVKAGVASAERCFDTVMLALKDRGAAVALLDAARERRINLRDFGDQRVSFSLDETTTLADVRNLWDAAGASFDARAVDDMLSAVEQADPSALPLRTSAFLQHEVFNRYHTEHEMLRYLHRLVSRDYGLAHGMIPLGSCTMKLNAAVEMIPITWDKFAHLHPFCPPEQALGYRHLFDDLEAWLAEITGLAATSLQPNAGSQGEYAGLMAIRAYHQSRASGLGSQGSGNQQSAISNQQSPSHPSSIIHHPSLPSRDVCLIPTSAHGTNPASAVTAGMRVVPVACRDNGDIDLDDLRAKAGQHADALACLMITYPSTHGVFEDTVVEACAIVHEHGGLVYMDGANMNAQVGLTSPGKIGADVCHLNLHKTFCIPHGGGGPGMGPICVNEKLRPFLPNSEVGTRNWEVGQSPDASEGSALPSSEFRHPTFRVSAAPFGSPMILPISWVYIALMGSGGLKEATSRAILNANYMAAKLRGYFDILYTGVHHTVAHEFILDCREFEQTAGVKVEDIAKRLMDYGFHAPTMSWPVPGTLMVEPTESESKAELDRFIAAMVAIRGEITAIEKGQMDVNDNPLKHAPHTAAMVSGDAWPHTYSREQAAFPLPELREPGRKYWPTVARIDNAYGDRHLVCTCAPMSAYA
jgi:glycine dehydrogenase